MGYDRYPRNAGTQRDDYGRRDAQDYGRDNTFSNARDYGAASDDRGNNRQDYGQRDRQRPGRGEYYGQQRQNADRSDYHGSYASDGRPFEDVGANRHADDDDYRQRDRQSGNGGRPQGYGNDDRGFFARAGDEVRSWFGDDDANRRRDMDQRYDERDQGNRGASMHDEHYHGWRRTQIAALDRDYDEYRQENRSKFDTEFGSWRDQRQTQRNSLGQVSEHMEVVGSDGGHVGTVDKVRGDRILLTKNDQDAGGRHHSIPSRWIDKVDDKVTISKTTDEAKSHWRDEERSQAMFGDEDANCADPSTDAQGKMLNRSFSGTY